MSDAIIERSTSAPVAPIALVSGDFVATGGMDRANLALASYLARADAGRELHIVAHRADDSLKMMRNVRFHRVHKPLNSYLLGAPLLDRAGIRVARQVAPAGGRVIVNGANCAWPDVNWVHYVHAAWKPGTVDDQPLLRRVKSRWQRMHAVADEASILPRASLVIANSHRTARDVIERVGVLPDRVHVVYYGVDASTFKPADDDERRCLRRAMGFDEERPLIAFIGALGDRRKGFDTLFDAWRSLCDRREWDADLVVLGAGADLARWRKLAASATLSDRIHFLGFRTDAPDVLRCCDALVSPTRYEAYGLGVHEAICCGLAVIVSACAGVAERLPGNVAPLLLQNPEDAEELAARLTSWRADSDRWRQEFQSLSEQWRARSWDDMAAEIATLLAAPQGAQPPDAIEYAGAMPQPSLAVARASIVEHNA